MPNFREYITDELKSQLSEIGYTLSPVFIDEPRNLPDIHYRLVADVYSSQHSEIGNIEQRELEFFVLIRFKTGRDTDKSGDIADEQNNIIELFETKFFNLLNINYENNNAKHRITGVEFNVYPTIDSAQQIGQIVFDGKYIYSKEWKI